MIGIAGRSAHVLEYAPNIRWLCWSIIRTDDTKQNDLNEWGDEDDGWWHFSSPLVKSDNHFCYLDSHVMREMNDCDGRAKQARVQMSWWNPTSILLPFFCFFLHLTEGMLAVSDITFGEKLHLEKCATSCTTLFNRCIWTSRFLIFGAYQWGFWTTPFSSI